MSTAPNDGRPLKMPAASAVWPVLFLATLTGGCWAVTVERMVLGIAIMAVPDHVPWLTIPMSM